MVIDMVFSEELFDNIVSIITALIACWALLRTSKIEYSQKGQRAHWFFDEYLFSIGKCMANFEKNKEEYYANYTRYLLYADRDIERQMKNIDNIIQCKDKVKVMYEIKKIKTMYTQKYKTEQYDLKKR